MRAAQRIKHGWSACVTNYVHPPPVLSAEAHFPVIPVCSVKSFALLSKIPHYHSSLHHFVTNQSCNVLSNCCSLGIHSFLCSLVALMLPSLQSTELNNSCFKPSYHTQFMNQYSIHVWTHYNLHVSLFSQ